jgi:hypothetical protein
MVAELTEIEQGRHSHGSDADLIPLSHLALDLSEPADGWTVWLSDRGVAISFDDLGRRAIRRGDAKELLDQQRQNEIRQQDHAARVEAEAIEKDREFRAALSPGIPWWRLDGVSYAQAAAEAARHPGRTPSPGEWLFGEAETMVYTELPRDEAT